MSIEHPNGWLYYYHPIHHFVVDEGGEPFTIPTFPDKDEDDEIRHKDNREFYVIHHRQRSVSIHNSQESLKVHRARRLYWDHISKYPAHHPLSVRQIIFRARKEAMLFLQWCSVGKCGNYACTRAVLTSIMSFLQRH
jgi:hypothetical protein